MRFTSSKIHTELSSRIRGITDIGVWLMNFAGSILTTGKNKN